MTSIKNTIIKKYILDNDIKSILKPFYIYQTIFFARIYNIAQDYITYVSWKYVVLTSVANLCNLILLYFEINYVFASIVNPISAIFYILLFVQFVFYFLVISAMNVGWSKKYLKLVLILQTANRVVHDPNDKLVILKKWICISIFTIVILNFAVAAAKFIFDPFWNWFAIVLFFLTVVLDSEMIYVNVVAYFLAYKIKRWNKLVSANLHFKENANEEDETEVAKLMFQTFNELLDAYELMGPLFKFRILIHVIRIFVQIMISLTTTILQTKWEQKYELVHKIYWGHIIGLCTATGRSFLLLTVLCVFCEEINSRIREVKTNMTSDLGQRKSVITRRLAKNVRRVAATRFRPLSACGVFTVDAALPLRVGALIATYTVVVLQFAFL